MTRYLTVAEVLEVYRRIMVDTGGAIGLRDLGALESAVAQPRMTFAGEELYPTITDKASALGFSLIQNHAFVDGNKRVGHAALELFLVLNGFQLEAELEEQVSTVLQVASSHLSREEFRNWITKHLARWP